MAGPESGLFVEWPLSDDSSTLDSAGLDLVLVHGLYGGSDESVKSRVSPGSGSSAWIDGYAQSSNTNSRVLIFKYNCEDILAGIYTRDAIQRQAISLLNGLSTLREKAPARSIMFISHDIGGLIVKDALQLAAIDSAKWAGIADYARTLIFSGCLQRSSDDLELQNQVSAFLLGVYKPELLKISPSLAYVPGIIDATVEINGLFVESKVYLRSYMVSIHAHESTPGRIHHVFDRFSGTLGFPFETCIAEEPTKSLEDNFSKIRTHLAAQSSVLTSPQSHLIDRERLFLSLAHPIDPFTTAPNANHGIHQIDAVKKWLHSPRDQVLHIYGTHGAHEAGEQLFYSIQKLCREDKNLHLTLYFSFDGWDERRSSLNRMLSTLWAQVVCHLSETYSGWTDTVLTQIAQEHCWTDIDLIKWFRKLQNWTPVRNISLVVNYVDECSSASYNSLIQLLSQMPFGNSCPCWIAITSQKHLDIAQGPSTWQSVDLGTVITDMRLESPTDMDFARLLQSHPELTLQRPLICETIESFSSGNSLSRHILFEQLRKNKNWSWDITRLVSFLREANNNKFSVELILDRVLRSLGDSNLVHLILTWLIYAARPLTVWELATAIKFTSRPSPEPWANFNVMSARETGSTLESWLAGIVRIEHNEIRIPDRRVRDIFSQCSNATDNTYIWQEIRGTAEFYITQSCLEYLTLSDIQEKMQARLPASASESIEPSCQLRRRDLCFYATQTWTYHAAQISAPCDYSSLLDSFTRSEAALVWAKVFWSVSNWATRPSQTFGSLYPVFAGVGLSNIITPSGQLDMSQGLIEAARNGQSSTVSGLISKLEYSESTLWEALLAVLSFGDERIALEILGILEISEGKEEEKRQWPPALMYRAAFLDLPDFAEKLLQMGCAPEPGGPMEEKTLRTPFLTAAAYNSTATMHVLMKHGADIHHRGMLQRTALHYTGDLNCIEAAEALVTECHDILDQGEEDGLTPVYESSQWGQYAMLKCLLELGADPNMGACTKTTTPRWSPLVAAAEEGHDECVRVLLDYGANTNIPGPWGTDTPLRYAAVNGHEATCRALLDGGADPNCPLISPPLLIELFNYSNEIPSSTMLNLLDLFLDRGAQANAKDESGTTALTMAVTRGEESLVRCLLDHGADPRASGDPFGLLAIAIDQGGSLIRLLAERGANLETRNHQDVTPLMYAATRCHTDALAALLQWNVVIDAEVNHTKPDWPGWTALCFAANHDNQKCLKLLIEAGADLSHRTADGFCPIHLAGECSALRLLLEYRKRIDIDERTSFGSTALMLATADPPAPIDRIKLLINAGANLNAQDKNGDTALTLAACQNNIPAASILLQEPDIDINSASPCYGAALHQACRNQSLEMMKILVEHEADVNRTVPGIPGTPLQSACLVFGDYEFEGIRERIEYLMDKGADITQSGGLFGGVLSVAALQCGSEVIEFLITKGARVDICNPHRCMPIHYAAFHGIETLVSVKEAGGDVTVRDKLGRSALHWAAQNGRVRAVDYLLTSLGAHAVNERDIDGWTPLCWAARGTNGTPFPSLAGESCDYLGTIQLLLRSGADVSVSASIGDETWSPLKIACYSRAPVEIVKALRLSPEQRVTEDEVKIAGSRSGWCDCCHWTLSGIYYTYHIFEEEQYDPPPESEWRSLLEELNSNTEEEQDSDSSSESSDSKWRARGRIWSRLRHAFWGNSSEDSD
ncbi:hypothetical protein G4B11_000108 [Aspergillus flavus]|nr:hypothetical protein G4B11_000108 [Aspergillus flavus]